jgi:hypothetical protein
MMENKSITAFLPTVFFAVVGVLILLEQYLNYEVWFQMSDIHHETFALSSFALAIGVLVGFHVRKAI